MLRHLCRQLDFNKTDEMKNLFIPIIMMSFFFIGCSPEEGDSLEAEVPAVPVKNVTSMKGGDDAAFYYENGLLLKGVGNSSSSHDHYYTGFQVEYDANQKVKRVLFTNSEFFPKPTDFHFDMTDGSVNGVKIYNYHFNNSRLQKITNSKGELVLELEYDVAGKVIEETKFQDFDNYIHIKYMYNSEGTLESYVKYDSYNSHTSSGTLTSDDKINPFYHLWKNTGLLIPLNISGLTAYNVPYYPHNINEIKDGDEIDFKAQLTYDGEYPVYYKEMMSDIEGVALEYQD